MKKVDVVILGAGLTGLSTAHFLKKAGRSVVVAETASRIGGSIHSFEENGFIYEFGPNTGTLSNPELVTLLDDLSESCKLETADENAKKRLILKNGEWHPLPSGLKSAINTPLFTLKDKFRILGEPFRAPGKDEHENLKDLVLRRLGKSFYEYAIDPFISGVYAGDPQKLIPKYALPKLYALEQTYGSFVKGSMKKARIPKTELEKRATKEVFSMQGGLGKLISALEQSVGKEHILIDEKEYSVKKHEEGFCAVTHDEEYIAQNVVSTMPPGFLNQHMSFLDSNKLETVSNFDYAPIIEIAVGFSKWKGIDINAFGGLIPSKENKDLLGILFMSSQFSGRAPEGGALFAVFMGGVRKKHMIEFSDEMIFDIVKEHFTNLMGVKNFNPDLFRIQRHKKAIPQYDIRSKERFEYIEDLEKEHAGLYLRGNMIDGIGMYDRVKQGKMIAEKIIAKEN